MKKKKNARVLKIPQYFFENRRAKNPRSFILGHGISQTLTFRDGGKFVPLCGCHVDFLDQFHVVEQGYKPSEERITNFLTEVTHSYLLIVKHKKKTFIKPQTLESPNLEGFEDDQF